MNLNFEKQKIEERQTLNSCSFRTFSDLFDILLILSCDCMEMMFSFIRSMYSLHPDDVGNKVAIAEGLERRLQANNLLWESKEANDDLT